MIFRRASSNTVENIIRMSVESPEIASLEKDGVLNPGGPEGPGALMGPGCATFMVSQKELEEAQNRVNAMKDRKLVPTSALVRIRSGDGQLHIVTKSLLDQSPYFKSVLSQRWCFPNKSEEIEVCCASESFTNLLNVLRYGQDAAFDLSASAKYMLLMDANYFGFPAVLFNKIQYPVQIARPCRKLPPIKVKASAIL